MSTIVTLKYDPAWRPLDWAKKNCKSYITNDARKEQSHLVRGFRQSYSINYYFGNERDAFLFKLAWSQELA